MTKQSDTPISIRTIMYAPEVMSYYSTSHGMPGTGSAMALAQTRFRFFKLTLEWYW
jgi:hypothetical protein